jgi:homoserine dehydrogenase
VIVTPATGAYGFSMANTYNGEPRAPVVFVSGGDARVVVRRETYEDCWRGTSRMPERYGVGLLGFGTVGSAFAELLQARADEVEAVTGLRPELTGVLTRSRGSFDDILAASDLVVEVMGGLDPARDYVLRAMAAGKHVVTANKQLLSQHGEELWAAASSNGVQLRYEAAVAGVVPVIRVLQESLAAATSIACTGSSTGRRTSSSAAWPRPAPRTRRAGRGPGARLRRGRSRPRTSTARTRRRRWRSSRAWPFNTPVHLDQVPYEGIEAITATTWSTRATSGSG